MGHKTAPAFLGVASLLHVLLHVVVRMLGVMPDSLRAGDIDAKLDVGVSIEIQLLVLVVGEVDLEAHCLWKENPKPQNPKRWKIYVSNIQINIRCKYIPPFLPLAYL